MHDVNGTQELGYLNGFLNKSSVMRKANTKEIVKPPMLRTGQARLRALDLPLSGHVTSSSPGLRF